MILWDWPDLVICDISVILNADYIYQLVHSVYSIQLVHSSETCQKTNVVDDNNLQQKIFGKILFILFLLCSL